MTGKITASARNIGVAPALTVICLAVEPVSTIERVVPDTTYGSAEAVQQVVNLQTQVFHARPLVVASILTLRFTTTRTKIGQKIVTPEQIFHHMNLGGELPAVALPPKDIVDWNQAVEVSSGRFTKNNMRSKL